MSGLLYEPKRYDERGRYVRAPQCLWEELNDAARIKDAARRGAVRLRFVRYRPRTVPLHVMPLTARNGSVWKRFGNQRPEPQRMSRSYPGHSCGPSELPPNAVPLRSDSAEAYDLRA
ncbi:hypothetical protein AAFF_G00360630 [Aldrovandia affinis]|uniref:Uncharacterized protein n=1 Tax=Aldrovandia affinis TaxID=143900 RepID=A0AAD7SJB7_9TELE|nr:hypothetical protein AAFF_G00360630 [Aldrovandia affinis]